MSPSWKVPGHEAAATPVDAAKVTGIPPVVLCAILAGKCRDQQIPVTPERQRRFGELVAKHCSSLWFSLQDAGVGPECAKGIALALALNDRFTSLDLACNTLGNDGAAVLAQVVQGHSTLTHVDLP